MSALDTAVRQVSAARAAVLAMVDDIQQGAAAIDTTDVVCVTGQGVAARTAYRAAEPAAVRTRAALTGLPRLLASYEQSLNRLSSASRSLDRTSQAAVSTVVRDGGTEAAAVGLFRDQAARAWTQYEVLLADTATWITRAVTPWYRDAAEGAAAYAVLVDGTRPALEEARSALGAAASAVRTPVAVQAATLRSADAALASLRGAG